MYLYCSLQAGPKPATNSTSTPLTPDANKLHGSNDDVFDDIQVRQNNSAKDVPVTQVTAIGQF